MEVVTRKFNTTGMHEFDASRNIQTRQDALEYMNAALETGDVASVNDAVGIIAKSDSVQEVSRRTGIARTNLYKQFAPHANPTLRTLIKTLKALDLHLEAIPDEHHAIP